MFGKAAKAIFALVIAGLGSLVTVIVGDATFHTITDGQWAAAALVALTAGGAVYGIRNAPPTP